MKILSLFLIFLTSQLIAQEKKEFPVKIEYEKTLKHYTDWKNNFDDVDYWKNITLTRVSDKKELKIKDLKDYERNRFYLSNLRRATFEMSRLNNSWEKEIETYTEMPPKQDGIPTVEELKMYVKKLTFLRKQTAIILEDYAVNFIQSNMDKITKDEADLLLKQIKDYHNEQKLTERKIK